MKRTLPSAIATFAPPGWNAYSPRTLLQLTVHGPVVPTVPAALNVFTLYVSLCAHAPWVGVDHTIVPARSATAAFGNSPPAATVTYSGSEVEVSCLPLATYTHGRP